MEDTELIQTEDITYPPIEKGWLDRSAHIVSLVFNPFIVTTAVFVMLFGCTYLRMLPAFYKQIAIGTTFSFTTFIPLTGIFVYLKLNKCSINQLNVRTWRHVPYLLTIAGYAACIYTMHRISLPIYMPHIVLTSLNCLTICMVINYFWKVSIHAAASGLLIGSLVSFSLIFQFNPLILLCVFVLLAGIIGTSRIIAGQHSLSEVIVGFCIGMFCGIAGILFI